MQILELLSQPEWLPLIWTLLHFLWQGAIVVIGAAALLQVFSVRRAPCRYAIYLAAFLLMAAFPFVTFMVIYSGQVGAAP